MRKAGVLFLVFTAASGGSVTDSSDTGTEARARVAETSLIVVATLLSAEEITANGVDYGQGLLQVDSVLYPEGFAATSLLLRWRNVTGTRPPRIDPRDLEAQRALWLLTMESDGTVALVDTRSALPLSAMVDLDRLLDNLWPMDGDPYGEKVLALEALVRSLPAESNRFQEPIREEDAALINDRIAFALRDYRTYPDFKAFAVAIDAKGRWVFGYRSEHPTEDLATDGALWECSVRAAKQRVEAPCRLYAVGDRLVWEE